MNDPQNLRTIMIGEMLLESPFPYMDRLGTFDEMLGCNKCNAIHHKDTRFGPIVGSEDGSLRFPKRIDGVTKSDESTCQDYDITGWNGDLSIAFEGGPLVKNVFTHTKYQKIW